MKNRFLSLIKNTSKEAVSQECIVSDISEIWNAPSYVDSRRFEPDPGQMEANRCMCMFSGSNVLEDYTQLRAQILQKTREKGWNTIMITSARSGAGKTVTAINLALTLAKTCDDTVLLVDCDLKNQTIYQYMGIPGDKGLVDILINGDVMNQVMVWPGIEKMTVISGGRSIQGSSELLGSPQMGALVAEMKQRYSDRTVFFDVPACLQSADALTFAPLVDAILIVVEEGATTHKDIDAVLGILPRDKIIGFVLNRKK